MTALSDIVLLLFVPLRGGLFAIIVLRMWKIANGKAKVRSGKDQAKVRQRPGECKAKIKQRPCEGKVSKV